MRQLSGDPQLAAAWCARIAPAAANSRVLVLLAGTDTAAVPGISAAGATPEARRCTAAADAELLLMGPGAVRPHALPPLPAGVSPALIAQVVAAELGLEPLVVDLGAPVAPAVAHVQLGQGPARCLSSGRAMPEERVQHLLALGQRWGRGLARNRQPLVLAECVPGGTTTAQAVLTALGVEAGGLVSGSLLTPAHHLKGALVARGLAAAGLTGLASRPPAVPRILAAVGDPMQALAAALVLEAAQAQLPVLLAGGSQMVAVLALALALATPLQRQALGAHVTIGTTAWVADEASSDLGVLLQRLAQRWGEWPLAFASGLRFHECRSPELLAYEQGYVKEGVGAGGLALLWELSGRAPEALAAACDRACRQLHQP